MKRKGKQHTSTLVRPTFRNSLYLCIHAPEASEMKKTKNDKNRQRREKKEETKYVDRVKEKLAHARYQIRLTHKIPYIAKPGAYMPMVRECYRRNLVLDSFCTLPTAGTQRTHKTTTTLYVFDESILALFFFSISLSQFDLFSQYTQRAKIVNWL